GADARLLRGVSGGGGGAGVGGAGAVARLRGGGDTPVARAERARLSGAVLRPENGTARPAPQPERQTAASDARRLAAGVAADAGVAGCAPARGRARFGTWCGCRPGRTGLGVEIRAAGQDYQGAGGTQA